MSNRISPGRIGIIGAGALGGFYGARLARAGFDVHFLMRRDYAVVRAKGLQVNSVDGDFHIQPNVYPDAESLGPCNLIIIAIKATDNAALPGLLRHVVAPGAVILTLQNGLGNEERIAEALSGSVTVPDSILGGVAFLCSNRVAPGVIEHTAHGWIRVAPFQLAETGHTQQVRDMFVAAGINCEIGATVEHIRWAKLLWNIPFNGLSVAAFHADTEVIMQDPELLHTARSLMHEVVEAARADGVELDAAEVEVMLDRTRSMGAYKSSMQLDHEAGRPIELEAIIGEPVRRARNAGIPVPKMEMLYALTRRIASANFGSHGESGVSA